MGKKIFYNKIKAITIFFIFNLVLASSPCSAWSQGSINNLNLQPDGNIPLIDNEESVAKVGGTIITVNDLKEYLSYRPISTDSIIKSEDILQRLDDMITDEALYQEAMRQNLHQDPKVKRIIHQILVRKLLEDEAENRIRAQPIDAEDLLSYYRQFKYKFNRPEQVRLADIFISLDQNEGIEKPSEKREKAESILAEALEKGKRPDFGRLIIKHSDTHRKYPLGDTGYMDEEGGPLGLSPKLAKAAFKLKKIGDICEHVIETEEGYHVIMLMDKRPAFHKPFDVVRDRIEQTLRKKRLEEARKSYLDKVKAGTNIQKNDRAISEFLKKLMKERRTETPITFPGI